MIMQNMRYGLHLAVGCFMIAGFLSLCAMVFKVSGMQGFGETKTYPVTAEFANIGGLKVHAPVTVSGVKVGEVTRDRKSVV